MFLFFCYGNTCITNLCLLQNITVMFFNVIQLFLKGDPKWRLLHEHFFLYQMSFLLFWRFAQYFEPLSWYLRFASYSSLPCLMCGILTDVGALISAIPLLSSPICDFQTRSNDVTWEFVKHAKLQAPPPKYWLRICIFPEPSDDLNACTSLKSVTLMQSYAAAR